MSLNPPSFFTNIPKPENNEEDHGGDSWRTKEKVGFTRACLHCTLSHTVRRWLSLALLSHTNTHTHPLSLSLSLSLSLCIYLSIYLSICIMHVCICSHYTYIPRTENENTERGLGVMFEHWGISS